MKLSLKKDLTPLKEEAKSRIDAAAEKERGKYITLGSGQAMVYDQKAKEAELYMTDENIPHGEIPHLVAEAEVNDITIFDQAVVYLTMRQQWLTISPIIESKRLKAKEAISAATNPEEIALSEVVDWTFAN